MQQRYIIFETCKKKVHFFLKTFLVKRYFCGEKTECNLKLTQYEEISTFWSLGRDDDDQLLLFENRGL